MMVMARFGKSCADTAFDTITAAHATTNADKMRRYM
jgi:hypothetical protein